MKKFIALILLTFYTIFATPLYSAASELYYIRNADKSRVLSIVQNAFNSLGYTIKNNDPVYGIKGADDAVAILQSTGSDLYYYYDSDSDKTLNTNIVKNVKNIGLTCKRYRNNDVAVSLAQTAAALRKSLSTKTKTYNFDNQPTSTPKYSSQKYDFGDDTANALSGYVAQIPVGTTIDVYLQSAVSTASAAKGDEVVAVLTKNWEYNGHVIAGQGSTVYGTVTKANSAGMAYRNGAVKFSFNRIQTTEGKIYNISTDPIEFKVDSTGKASDAATKVIGRAALGAVLGLVVGALSKDVNIGSATAIGAGAGAAWGAGSAVMERGTDAEIPTYTELVITLTAPLNVVISN